MNKINEYKKLMLELHSDRIEKAKKLDDLTKKYRRGLLLDDDVINIVKEVFRK